MQVMCVITLPTYCVQRHASQMSVRARLKRWRPAWYVICSSYQSTCNKHCSTMSTPRKRTSNWTSNHWHWKSMAIYLLFTSFLFLGAGAGPGGFGSEPSAEAVASAFLASASFFLWSAVIEVMSVLSQQWIQSQVSDGCCWLVHLVAQVLAIAFDSNLTN